MPGPPAPGPFVRLNLSAVEDALSDVTFPISRPDLIEQVEEDATALVDGKNVSLRDLIHEIHDDFFRTEDEFMDALETAYERLHRGEEQTGLETPTDAQGRALTELPYNDPSRGGERGISDLSSYLDSHP